MTHIAAIRASYLQLAASLFLTPTSAANRILVHINYPLRQAHHLSSHYTPSISSDNLLSTAEPPWRTDEDKIETTTTYIMPILPGLVISTSSICSPLPKRKTSLQLSLLHGTNAACHSFQKTATSDKMVYHDVENLPRYFADICEFIDRVGRSGYGRVTSSAG
ncbi:hypothetical protein BDW75DRAFT_221418 [Aspergillus navahoensis]